MLISELEKTLNIKASTIRYYEKQGLISFKRESSGYRIIDDADVEHLKLLLIMKYAGYTIEEMRDIVAMQLNPEPYDCEQETRTSILNKREEILNKIKNYQRILSLVDALLPKSYLFVEDESSEDLRMLIDDIYHTIKEDL